VGVEGGGAERGAWGGGERGREDGEPLAVFPEGTRRHGRDIVDLFDGAVYLASRAGVPIVPVGIGGSEQILASGRSLPRPHKVAVVVGDPIQAPDRRNGRVPRPEMTNATEKVRLETQSRFAEALALAGVAFGEPSLPRRSAGELGENE